MREDYKDEVTSVPLSAGWAKLQALKFRLHFGLKNEGGQSLVIGALGFCTVLAFTAFAIDAGMMFQTKRKVQIAADAAALAAAQDYLYNASGTSATATGKAASSTNGYTDGTNATVTINEPPSAGPNSSTTGMVEAIVSTPMKTMFLGLMGTSTMTIKARAVAGSPQAGDACIWLLNPTAQDLQVQGAYDIVATNCGIYDNSSSSSSVSVTGNGGTMNTAFLDTVGTSVGHQTQPTPITTNTAPRSDPWGSLTGPVPTITTTTTGSGHNAVTTTTVTWTGCDYTDSTTTTLGSSSGSTTYINPGTVIGGAGKVFCYSQPVTINNATFGACSTGCTTPGGETITTSAGTLAFAQGVTIGGNVTVYGGTIDIAAGTFNQANQTLSVVAPTSGTYNGIGILQPTSNTNQLQVQFGSGNESLDGYIFAPGAQVYLQDNGGGITVEGIVANTLFDKASTLTVNSYDLLHPTTTLNRVLTLVE